MASASANEAGANDVVVGASANEVGAEADLVTKYNRVIYILNACNIPCNSIGDLDGMLVAKETCINTDKYNYLKTTEFPLLKKLFSSSYLTALQDTATSKQKWPLLNLIRQLLRSCNYKLTPKRVSDGYTLTGEKKYKRMFIIEKMQL
jgi:hypothetical protein